MTFCVVVDAELKTDVCPLPDNSCFYKHKVTGKCMYTQLKNEKNVNTMLAAVGEGVELTPQEIKFTINKIKQSIKEQL